MIINPIQLIRHHQALQATPAYTLDCKRCFVGGSQQHEAMPLLVAAGFATQGATLDRGSIYFHATKAGCKLVGLDSAGIRRAFEE